MPWKTARDNVAVALEPHRRRRAGAAQPRRTWLKKVGLAAFGDRYPHQLSGGQRKARARQMLIRDPQILLMDEPFRTARRRRAALMGDLLLDLWSADRKAGAVRDARSRRRRSRLPTASSSCRLGRRRASSPTAASTCRVRAEANEIRLDPKFHDPARGLGRSAGRGDEGLSGAQAGRGMNRATLLSARLVASLALTIWHVGSSVRFRRLFHAEILLLDAGRRHRPHLEDVLRPASSGAISASR